MPLSIISGPIIAAGESLSDGVDVSAGKIVRITTPGGWDAANLTFQISSDGASGYNDMYDAQGNEITVVTRGDNSAIIVHERWTHAINFIKFRSGTAKHPVVQKADREFAIAIEVDEPVA